MSHLSVRENSGLLTDLYELTMAAGYFQSGFEARATFELFVRELPKERNYLVAAGLAQALDFLERARFAPEEVTIFAASMFFGTFVLNSSVTSRSFASPAKYGLFRRVRWFSQTSRFCA